MLKVVQQLDATESLQHINICRWCKCYRVLIVPYSTCIVHVCSWLRNTQGRKLQGRKHRETELLILFWQRRLEVIRVAMKVFIRLTNNNQTYESELTECVVKSLSMISHMRLACSCGVNNITVRTTTRDICSALCDPMIDWKSPIRVPSLRVVETSASTAAIMLTYS